MRISLLTLGCSKNTVDSERLAGILKSNGFDIIFESLEKSDIAVVNTCGFILDSQEESIDTILNCIELKKDKRRRLKKVYVFGCLVARNMSALQESIPEVDGWFGVNDVDSFAKEILKSTGSSCNIDNNSIQRLTSTPNHYAYLKISEGCNKFCSFCAIPYIRGSHVSRKKEDILKEARFLADQGVKELILIAQDLTFYGSDLYNSLELCALVKQLSTIGFTWIRLHYAHPNEITDDVLDLFNTVPNLCKYLDIPLQHISTSILKSMKRNIDKEGSIALINNIRKIVPDIAIRTSFIVGYPGETEEQFNELVEFVENSKFDRVGVFTFSSEDGTAANDLIDDVPEDVKISRKEKLLAIQQKISLLHNESFVGKKIQVLVDSVDDSTYYGRTQYDSPEVDNEVIINTSHPLKIGEYYDALITSADFFDLEGTI